MRNPARKILQILVLTLVFTGGIFSLSASSVLATVGVNRQINFQGKVVNKVAGTNVANGNYDFAFNLYNVSSDGSPIWTETRTGGNQVAVTDGIFQVSLGSVTTFASAGVDFTNDSLYLDVTFNGETMGTRIRLSSAVYSLFAEKTQGLSIVSGKTVTFADDFTTAGAFPLTLTQTATTNVTLPTTGTLATLAGNEALTNKTIGSTGLVFSGATTDLDTAAAEGLTLQGRAASSFLTTAGNISFQAAGTGTIASIQIGAGGAGSTTPDYFGLDVKSDTGDPAGGYEGAMYYNTSDNKFRCYQNIAWTDCIGSGGTSTFSGLTGSTNTTAAMVVGTGASLNFENSGTINASSLLGGTWAIPGTIGSSTPNTAAFSTLTSNGSTTLGTGTSLTNTFGSGASSINTIGSVTTPGALTLHGATTLDANFSQTGTTTFSTGTTSVALNGDTTIAANKGLTFTSGTGVIAQNFSGTTTTAHTLTANSLTSGKGLYITSSATGLTGALQAIDWSPGAVSSTGDLLSINVGAGAVIGHLMDLKDNSSTVLGVTQTAVTANIPVAFNAAGDVGIVYDLNFTNSTTSNIKSAAPLTIVSGEVFNSSDLTLRTYNSGSVILDSHLLVSNSSVNGKAVGIFNQTESQDIFTASAAGVTKLRLTNAGGLILAGGAGDPTATSGTVWYDTTANKFKIVENGTVKTLCNTTDLGCGTGGGGNLDMSNNLVLNIGAAGTDFTAGGGLTLATDLTLSAQGDVRFADADSSNWVAFQAPSTVGSNLTWTLPSADGTGCLKSNGSLTLSFDGACGETDYVAITASGVDYSKPSNTLLVVVEAWGPGGGGGGGGSVAAGTATTGGGAGGGGAYHTKSIAGGSLAATETVTIPAGGTGGAGGTNAAGQDGSAASANTTFGSLLTAYRGGGGANGNNSATGGGGGGGGGSVSAGANSTAAAGGIGGNPGAAAVGVNGTGNGGGGGGTTVAGSGTYGGGGGGGLAAGGTAGRSGGGSQRGGGGGGGGGSNAATHAGTTGGLGGATTVEGGARGATQGGAGGDGATNFYGGSGGGGGASATSAAGGNGGAGGAKGGGGGGGGAGGTAAVAGGTGGTGGRGEVVVWTYRGTGADFAEIYGSNDGSLEAGDVVAIDPTMRAGVKKTSQSYDSQAIGIVSTNPGVMVGSVEDPGASPVMVALVGRVPVKVNMENGPIKTGDLLTPSSVPGVAMKATKAGLIIGQSMTNFEENMPGFVVAFIRNGYAHGSKLAEIEGLDLSETDTEKVRQQKTLTYLMENKLNLEASSSISEIYTDRVTVGLEIIVPTVVADFLNTNRLYANDATVSGTILVDTLLAKKIEGLDEMIFGSTASGILNNRRDMSFSGFARFMNQVFIQGELNLEGQVIFNKDTAGIAIIPPIAKKVEVKFEKEYASPPVVNISLRLEDATQSATIADDIRAAVSNVTTKGFSIVMDQYSPRIIQFNWIAISVKNMGIQVGESLVPGSMPVIEPSPTPDASISAIVTNSGIQVATNSGGLSL